jgi:hypothetical protein
MGILASFLGVERTKLEADRDPYAEIKNERSYTSMPPPMSSRRGKGLLYLFIRHSFRHTRIEHKEYDTEQAIHGPSRSDVSMGRSVVQIR